MSDLHRIQIECPSGVYYGSRVLLDGVELKNVRRVAFDMNPGSLVVCTLEMFVDLTVEARLVELFERRYGLMSSDDADAEQAA